MSTNSTEDVTNKHKPCRLSWYLVEINEGLYEGGESNDNLLYIIVNLFEVTDKDPTNMYISRRLRFRQKSVSLEGQLILASDNYSLIKNQLKVITNDYKQTVFKRNQLKLLLVQYQKNERCVVQRIINENEVIRDESGSLSLEEILLYDGEELQMAKVLHINKSYDLMLKKLDTLKAECFGEVSYFLI